MTAPRVITARGPRASRIEPTFSPAIAETTSPADSAPVMAVSLQPVSWEIGATAAGRE